MALKEPVRDGRTAGADVATRIEDVATRLFILHGYHGASYLDIARELGITHSTIHYHYRSKSMLAEAVLRRAAGTMLDAMARIWTDPATSLFDKFVATRDWTHGQYLLSNPQGKGGRAWGLLTRFTGDAEALTLPMRRLIRTSVTRLEEHIAAGVDAEAARGALVADAPRDGITLQIASLLSIAGQITRQASGFERLDALMRCTHATIDRAYGASPRRRTWPALPPVRRTTTSNGDGDASPLVHP